MKYFNENMTSIQSRLRYFDLMLYHPVEESKKAEVQEEYEKMIRINSERETEELLKAKEEGYILIGE